MKLLHAFALAAICLAGPAAAQVASPYAIDIPPWFATSFLDFRDEVADAARTGRRVMIYVGQDGCPYCTKLMTANFSQADIVATTRERFVPIALNLWGDRETTWVDGGAQAEKALAQRLGVQFTPTLIFLDEGGNVVARLDGYWPPQRFRAVLDYVAAKRETVEPLADWLAVHAKETPRPPPADEPFLMRAPLDLAKRKGGKPLAVVVESADCEACDEMHREAFGRRDVLRELGRFDVARILLGSSAPLRSPSGRRRPQAPSRASSASPTRLRSCSSTRPAARCSGSRLPAPVPLRVVVRVRRRRRVPRRGVVPAVAARSRDRMRARGQRVELWE
jgi:thioredoxin-related protein